MIKVLSFLTIIISIVVIFVAMGLPIDHVLTIFIFISNFNKRFYSWLYKNEDSFKWTKEIISYINFNKRNYSWIYRQFYFLLGFQSLVLYIFFCLYVQISYEHEVDCVMLMSIGPKLSINRVLNLEPDIIVDAISGGWALIKEKWKQIRIQAWLKS